MKKLFFCILLACVVLFAEAQLTVLPQVTAGTVLQNAGTGTNVTLNSRTVFGGSTNGTFGATVGQNIFNGVTDESLFWGFNYAAGGGLVDNTLPNIGMQIENDYYDGVNHYLEYSLNTTYTNGAVYRWLAFSADRSNPTNATTYCNINIGTGGNSAFAVILQQSQGTLFRVAPNGYCYVTTLLATPAIQNQNGGFVRTDTGMSINTAITNAATVRGLSIYNGGGGTGTGASLGLGYSDAASTQAGIRGYYDGTGVALGIWTGGVDTNKVLIDSAGKLTAASSINATNGFLVGSATGLTTNINVIIAGNTTNQLQFTKGILTGVVPQ